MNNIYGNLLGLVGGGLPTDFNSAMRQDIHNRGLFGHSDMRGALEKRLEEINTPFCPECEHCQKEMQRKVKLLKKAQIEKEKKEAIYKEKCKQWVEKIKKLMAEKFGE